MLELEHHLQIRNKLEIEDEEGIHFVWRHPIDVELNWLSAVSIFILYKGNEVEVLTVFGILEFQTVFLIHEGGLLLGSNHEH